MDSQFQQVSRRLAGLAAKRPGFALGLWGEPGIGKTHTALALLRGAPCQSFTVHATQSLEAIINAIPRPKKISIWLERSLERLKRGEVLEAGTLIQTLAALLAANAPIILHVEDLHEAEADRLKFWTQLAPIISRMRGVGLIATSRTRPPDGFEAIKLSALNREASDALLEAEAGATLPPEALGWVFEKAVGNPLFTLEFFRFLARQGFLWNDGKRWRWRVPEREIMPVTVEALIEHLLRDAARTPALENAIGAKALLGLGATDNLWTEVAGLTLEDLSAIKQELEHQGVLANAEFAHPLFREVALRNLLPEIRQNLAQRAFEALKAKPEAAFEFIGDAKLKSEIALEWLRKSARDAQDEVLAGQFLVEAIKYSSPQESVELTIEAAERLLYTDINLVLDLVKNAVLIDLEDVRLIYLLARLLASERLVSQAEVILERLPETERMGTQWLTYLIQLYGRAGEDARVLALLQQSPELMQIADVDMLNQIARSHLRYGNNAEAKSFCLQILDRSDLSGKHKVNLFGLLAHIELYEGDYAASIGYCDRAIQICKELNHAHALSAMLFNQGPSLISIGNISRAIENMSEALKISSKLGDSLTCAEIQGRLGNYLIKVGQYVLAEEYLLESENILLRTDTSAFLVDTEVALVELYLNWDIPYGRILCLKYATNALFFARQVGGPRILALALTQAAQAEIRNGNPLRGLELISEALPLQLHDPRRIIGAKIIQANANEALGQAQKALLELEMAFEHAKEIGLLFEMYSASLEIARLTNNLERARTDLAWFEERGLQNGVNIALRYFPELALSTTPISSITEPSFHLEVLGSMQVMLESQLTPVRGRKRQELLALLLEARISGRVEVSKLELVEKLYPDSDELQSNAGIRDVIYQVRSSLGEGAITTTTNGYALGNLGSDIEEFLKDGDTKRWRGTYLEGLTLEGSDTVRESVYLALRSRAEALLETDPVEVARLGRLLCEADPYDLEAVRLTLTGLRSGQNHRSLSRFYEQARARYLEIGEALPESWQVFLSPVTNH